MTSSQRRYPGGLGNKASDPSLAYLSHGRLSHDLGLTLLIAALAVAMFLDPWSFGDGVSPDASLRAREAQLALMRAGFLQLFLGAALQRLNRNDGLLSVAVAASIAGALGAVAAHTFRFLGPDDGYTVTASALVGLSGLIIVGIAARRQARPLLLMLLAVTAGGLILDAIHGLALSDPPVLDLGASDDLRLRLLRLACMAAVALPLLGMLADELALRSPTPGGVERWSRIMVAVGAIGLPASLVAAAFVDLRLKYLLPPFADALLIGVVLGWWLARRLAAPLEVWGWGLIAASMTTGLLMGGYAFDGPLEPPRFLGEYVDVGRQLSRVIHVYAMVFGFLLIIAARSPGMAHNGGGNRRARILLLVAIVTPIILLLQRVLDLPALVLSIGPAALLLVSLQSLRTRPKFVTPARKGE